MDLALASKLTRPEGGKIVFCAIDGLGGLAREETLRSELEKADITHLDRLAARSEVGLTEVAGPGLTPGPRIGLLALLGYDPLEYGPGAAIPAFSDTWKARAVMLTHDETAAGVARSAGIEVLPGDGVQSQIATVRVRLADFDVFILHITAVAEAAFARDFPRKCHALSEFDAALPDLQSLGADVLAIGGPRSIPALLATPTWHPVPLLVSSVHGREGNAQHFNEQECLRGSLGIMRAADVMPLLFAHALRLQPYGD